MILADKDNQSDLMKLVPAIKEAINEWQIISFSVPSDDEDLDSIKQQILEMHHDREGLLFEVNPKKLLMLIRLGFVKNYGLLKDDFEKKLTNKSCRVIARKMSANGLKHLQIDLSKQKGMGSTMYDKRATRQGNIILIADDDMFVRTTMKETLSFNAVVEEVDNGDEVKEKYISANPDILFLDIHMPGKNGLLLIDEILDIDTDAFIVMFSADAVKDNVLKAMSLGAVGFLVKPIKSNKIKEYLHQCITYNPIN